MNKLQANIGGHAIELWYNKLGSLDAVYKEGKALVMETMYSGTGYTVRMENGALMNMAVCDARYAYIRDLKIFVPRLLFVEAEPTKSVQDEKLQSML